MPVFLPVVQQVGIDPVHFGLVMVLNLMMIGTLTPPIGIVLFVVARVANLSFTSHWVERLEVFGHGRSAVVDTPDRVSVGRDGRAEVTDMTSAHMGWAQVADKMGFRQEVEHFFECVRTRAEPRTGAAEALRTQALMDRLLGAMGLPLAGEED